MGVSHLNPFEISSCFIPKYSLVKMIPKSVQQHVNSLHISYGKLPMPGILERTLWEFNITMENHKCRDEHPRFLWSSSIAKCSSFPGGNPKTIRVANRHGNLRPLKRG